MKLERYENETITFLRINGSVGDHNSFSSSLNDQTGLLNDQIGRSRLRAKTIAGT